MQGSSDRGACPINLLTRVPSEVASQIRILVQEIVEFELRPIVFKNPSPYLSLFLKEWGGLEDRPTTLALFKR